MIATQTLFDLFTATRRHTEALCKPLQTEDYVVQPVIDVSPPKWHLGHTTWFFETFILKEFAPGYTVFSEDFAFIFNSYYETLGKRVVRADRGNLSRPGVKEVYAYRNHVTEALRQLLESGVSKNTEELVTIGIHHEKQHQELLLTDIKYILGNNPLLPAYGSRIKEHPAETPAQEWISVPEGIYEIGHISDDFCFDNELGRHKVYLQPFEISNRLVTNGEYLNFIKDGGYTNFALWHAEGWDRIKTQAIEAPLYWHDIEGTWHHYTLEGLKEITPESILTHISYYEAFAFARWKGVRLPTEFEWEAANSRFSWGNRWEWTESAYLPYPGYKTAEGALGEYNGKFMVNQKVLRGGSVATPEHHTRYTYRNFFHPPLRWQYTGIRLARSY